MVVSVMVPAGHRIHPVGSNEENTAKGWLWRYVQSERTNKELQLWTAMASPELRRQEKEIVFYVHSWSALVWKGKTLFHEHFGTAVEEAVPAEAGSIEGSSSTSGAELKNGGSGRKHPSLPAVSCRCLHCPNPSRSQLTQEPGWYGCGSPPSGAQSRADNWSWADGGGDANDKDWHCDDGTFVLRAAQAYFIAFQVGSYFLSLWAVVSEKGFQYCMYFIMKTRSQWESRELNILSTDRTSHVSAGLYVCFLAAFVLSHVSSDFIPYTVPHLLQLLNLPFKVLI